MKRVTFLSMMRTLLGKKKERRVENGLLHEAWCSRRDLPDPLLPAAEPALLSQTYH